MIRTRTVVAIALLLGGGWLAQAQEDSASEPAGTAARNVTEEIVVRGTTRGSLRLQIELAEDAIFDRFNAINSNDEFDIHCRLEVRTGTRIPQRVCQANFWRQALRGAGQATVRQLQGTADISESVYQAEAMYKSRLLETEMTELARQDSELLSAIVRFQNLTTTLENFDDPSDRSDATLSRIATSADQALPYDAAVMAEVRVRSEPWRHVLTHPTFAIAHVFGEIAAVELSCRERSQTLEFESGAEWHVPSDWEPCSVSVLAGRGTTFSFYEFD